MIEICCYTLEDALQAKSAGAGRIELCGGFESGGCTPNMGRLHLSRHLKGMQIFVMIRPRGGNFIYNEYEFEEMIFDILTVKELGLHGIVTGILNPDYSVDTKRMAHLVSLAKPLEITFHRAFDLLPDPYKGIDQLAEMGVQRVLSSGMASKAVDGIELLSSLNKYSNNRVKIIAGGGVNAESLSKLYQAGIREFHASCSVRNKAETSKSILNFSQTPLQNHEYLSADSNKIRSLVSMYELLTMPHAN